MNRNAHPSIALPQCVLRFPGRKAGGPWSSDESHARVAVRLGHLLKRDKPILLAVLSIE